MDLGGLRGSVRVGQVMARYGRVWHSVAQYGMVWHSVARVWHGLVGFFGTFWHGVAGFGWVWDMITPKKRQTCGMVGYGGV